VGAGSSPNAKNKKTVCVSVNRKILTLLGTINSLVTSFSPSAIGCNKPQIPTTFGPFLRCTEAIIFLSVKVKKATEIIIGIIRSKLSIMSCNITKSIE
jgi:hypothetical protein